MIIVYVDGTTARTQNTNEGAALTLGNKQVEYIQLEDEAERIRLRLAHENLIAQRIR